MIDLHTHTEYSKHATGTVDEVVRSAIDKGIKIIAITDHAPFPVDDDNRLHEEELEQYFRDIGEAKERYNERIKVLVGLEVDFTRRHQTHAEGLISRVNVDYIIGGIHYIFLNGERVNVWDINRTGEDEIKKVYFEELRALVQSNLFDAVAHPDILLRGGLDETTLYELFLPLLDGISERKLCYELNASGFTKPSYDRKEKRVVEDIRTYPSVMIMEELGKRGVRIVVGSDSHSIDFVGKNVKTLLKECEDVGIENLVYFENREVKRALL
jgi:histidinol-phosphatase (PHP family)